MIPTLLGDGLRLFSKRSKETRLELITTQSSNGMTDLVYEQNDDPRTPSYFRDNIFER